MENSFNSKEAVNKLKEKGISNYTCPFCGGRQFSVNNELATISVTDEIKTINIGNYIPAAILICNKCGNLQFFALAKLGMIRNENGEGK